MKTIKIYLSAFAAVMGRVLFGLSLGVSIVGTVFALSQVMLMLNLFG